MLAAVLAIVLAAVLALYTRAVLAAVLAIVLAAVLALYTRAVLAAVLAIVLAAVLALYTRAVLTAVLGLYASYASRHITDRYAVGLPAVPRRANQRSVSRHTTRMAIITTRVTGRFLPPEGDCDPGGSGR